MIVVRIFVGLSQLRWQWAIRPSSKVEVQVAHARVPETEGVGALRGDRHGLPPVAEDEVHDREVVGRQVPEDVDLLLDQPEVHADRVVVEELSQLAAGERSRIAWTACV